MRNTSVELMSFFELRNRAIELLRQHGRVTYSALKLELGLDEEQLAAIKDELIYAHKLAEDEQGRVLVYRGTNEVVDRLGPASTATSQLGAATSGGAHEITCVPLKEERKHVTVLFADIKNSTALIRSLDPEDAREILDPAVEVMINAIHRYEGTVNQVLGDGIMALFGAPVAREDHAIRACYAAFDMLASIQAYSENLEDKLAVSLEIGIGMNSGEVLVRTIGNDLHTEYSAVGETTHFASKVQTAAKPSTILITRETARLVEGLVELEHLGPIAIPGITVPLEAFALLDVTSDARRMQVNIAQGLTHFVGRDLELLTLQRVLDKARQGKGQLLAIVGEPGVGKSRVIYEFVNSDACLGCTVLQGSSVSYGKVRAYFPVIHLLREYFELHDDLSPDKIQAVVKTRLLGLTADLKESIFPILALLDALPQDSNFRDLDPKDQHRASLEALRRLFFYEGQRQPLIVIFEDLHCIDNATQTVLDNLVEMLPTSHILLIVTYRPEYRHGWANKSYYTQIHLSHLSFDAVYTMLEQLLGNHSTLDRIKPLLAERTQGNPFFLEEMVRSLAETSIIEGDKGDHRLSKMPEKLDVPSTVHAVLAARIDRLTPTQKGLLQTAAVIGRNVPLPLLQEVTNLSESELENALATLTSAEFIYQSQLYPERTVAFKHALTNEVAYESLLRGKRRALHAKLVEVLEKLTEGHLDEQAQRIAPHAMLGELWDKAATYFWKAGRKAMSVSAAREACECFKNALSATDHLPASRQTDLQKIDLRLELRTPLYFLSSFDELHACLQEAEFIAQRISDHRRLGQVINFLISYYGLTGEHLRSIEVGRRGLEINRTAEPNIVSHYFMGLEHHHVGQYRESIQFLKHVLARTRDARFRHERFGTAFVLQVNCRTWLAQSAAQLGEFEYGQNLAVEAVELGRQADHPSSLAFAHISLGFVHLLQGRVDAAVKTLQECLAIVDANNVEVLMPHINSTLGYAYVLAGDIDAAIPLLKNADTQSKSAGRKAAWALRLTWLGHANLLRGELTQAREQAERATVLAQETAERGNEAWARKLLGDVLQEDSSDCREPLAQYTASMELARELQMCPLQGHVHLSLGRLHRRENHIDQAKDEISLALAAYRSLNMPTWGNTAEKELAGLPH